MSEFWKAIASGDISVLKKIKGAGDKEDGSWDSIEDKVE
jgi:Holliday junction resolvasome RuvABC DNA-binding subunit